MWATTAKEATTANFFRPRFAKVGDDFSLLCYDYFYLDLGNLLKGFYDAHSSPCGMFCVYAFWC